MQTIAINGFGRIGRTFLRVILNDPRARASCAIAAINIGPADPSSIALLVAHDSIMGKLAANVSYENGILAIDTMRIAIIAQRDPATINWKQYNIDWVVESSGHFTSRDQALQHCAAGAKKVLITAPSPDADITIIPGVNMHAYDAAKHTIISLGSCTTNCFTPIVKVIDDIFGLVGGHMTTVHSYTNDQVLLDSEHHDPRRARAAAMNIIPTKTGASALIGVLFPHLNGAIHAYALRVPTPNVSLLDFSFISKTPLSAQSLNEAFVYASKNALKNILSVCDLPLVSTDFKGNPCSAIVDATLTHAEGTLGKVVAWYDNEWGYSERLKDFLLHNL